MRLGSGLAMLLFAGCVRVAPPEPPPPPIEQAPSAAAAAVVAPSEAPAPAPERLVAEVNGVAVPWSAFDVIYSLKAKKYADRGREMPPSADLRYRTSIVDRLIHHEMLRQRVVELGIDVDAASVDERALLQHAGIRDWAMHLERRGESEASLREMIVAELREQLILEQTGELEVSRAELEAEYDAVKRNYEANEPRIRASHILVAVASAAPGDDPARLEAAARAEADRLYALARAPGADFAALAQESSSGPSREKGGDLGIFRRDRMEEAFSRVAFAMKVGQISKPVQTKFGFHIIKVTGKWPRGRLPLEALEDALRERIEQRKLHVGRKALKVRLQAEYPVVHHLLEPEEADPSLKRGPPYADWPDDVPPI